MVSRRMLRSKMREAVGGKKRGKEECGGGEGGVSNSEASQWRRGGTRSGQAG